MDRSPRGLLFRAKLSGKPSPGRERTTLVLTTADDRLRLKREAR